MLKRWNIIFLFLFLPLQLCIRMYLIPHSQIS